MTSWQSIDSRLAASRAAHEAAKAAPLKAAGPRRPVNIWLKRAGVLVLTTGVFFGVGMSIVPFIKPPSFVPLACATPAALAVLWFTRRAWKGSWSLPRPSERTRDFVAREWFRLAIAIAALAIAASFWVGPGNVGHVYYHKSGTY